MWGLGDCGGDTGFASVGAHDVAAAEEEAVDGAVCGLDGDVVEAGGGVGVGREVGEEAVEVGLEGGVWGEGGGVWADVVKVYCFRTGQKAGQSKNGENQKKGSHAIHFLVIHRNIIGFCTEY